MVFHDHDLVQDLYLVQDLHQDREKLHRDQIHVLRINQIRQSDLVRQGHVQAVMYHENQDHDQDPGHQMYRHVQDQDLVQLHQIDRDLDLERLRDLVQMHRSVHDLVQMRQKDHGLVRMFQNVHGQAQGDLNLVHVQALLVLDLVLDVLDQAHVVQGLDHEDLDQLGLDQALNVRDHVQVQDAQGQVLGDQDLDLEDHVQVCCNLLIDFIP